MHFTCNMVCTFIPFHTPEMASAASVFHPQYIYSYLPVNHVHILLLLCIIIMHSRPTTSSHVRYTAAILYIVSRGSLNYLHRKQLRWGSNTTIRLHSTPSQKFAFINKQQKISSEPDWNIAVLNVKLAPSNNFFSDGEGASGGCEEPESRSHHDTRRRDCTRSLSHTVKPKFSIFNLYLKGKPYFLSGWLRSSTKDLNTFPRDTKPW